METTSAPKETSDSLNPLYKKLDQIDQQQQVLNQERNIILEAIRLLEPDYKPQPEVQLPDFVVQKDKDPSEDLNIDISDLIVDFDSLNTQKAKLFLLFATAQRAGKFINTRKYAQYFIDHKQSNGQQKNMVTTINHLMNEHPGYFEKVKPGTYRYVPDGSYEPNTNPTEDLLDDLPNSQDSSQ